jgi:drug/metabolite transporter (DMT)-like permease
VQPFDFKAIGQTVDLGGSKVSVFVVLLWIGLVGMAGGVILGVSAQQRISPASANLVLSLEVVVGTALAAWLLAESLTVPQLVGATTMLLGIVAAQWGMTRVSNDRRPSS